MKVGWRAYLRLARAQTAAVEGAGFPLAAWIGGAPLWALPLFALLGILCHFGGFGENGITDLSYDRADPSKATHPLVTGALPRPRAMAFVLGCQMGGLVLFYGVFGWLGHAGDSLPFLAFLSYVVLGHVYNFLGKRWKPGAVMEISGAFALAFLACATAWTGRASVLVWAVMAYAGAMTAFQIAIAGELKELGQANEKNLLRRLGARIARREAPRGTAEELELDAGPRVWTLSMGLTGLKLATLIVIAFLAVWWWGVFTAGVAGVALTVYTAALLAKRTWDRPKLMRLMGLGEAGSYLLLVLALVPRLGVELAVGFLVLPVVWYTGMNRALWVGTGSSWAPGV